MKRIKLVFLSLFLCAVALLSACTSVPAMSGTGNDYVNQQTGITYSFANGNYIVLSSTGEAVAKIDRDAGEDMLLYAIDGVAPERFLAADNGALVYASNQKLPALWEMGVTAIDIFRAQQTNLSVLSVNDEALISSVVKAYQNGVFFPKTEILPGNTSESYEMRFAASASYAGIGYTLHYLCYQKDVCVYVPVEDQASYENAYPGMEFTFEELKYTDSQTKEEKTELVAVYNFGKELIYDRSTGLCCTANALLGERLS